MRKFTAFLAAILVLSASGIAMASNVATQSVTYEVAAINEISISGAPAALIINTATAGSTSTAVSNLLTTYNITTNETKKITGSINDAMPAGVTLTVALAAPGIGTSAGAVTMTAAAADLVTGVTQVASSNNAITYNLSATLAAGVVASAAKTLTLTIAAP